MKGIRKMVGLKKLKEKKGFTLIEMIIVIAIIAILIALIAPNMMKFLQTAQNTKAAAAAKTLYTSAQTYVTERFVANDPVPDATYSLTDIKSDTKLKNFAKDYFNENELATFKDASFEVKNGVVIKASVEMAGADEGKYPSEKKTTTTTP